MALNRNEVSREIQERYRQSGRSLNEFQRRIWAAREALKLGRGGITIVSQALRISPNTIKKGMREIAAGLAELNLNARPRIRKPGGGRKSKNSLLPPFAGAESTRDGGDEVSMFQSSGDVPL